MHNTNASVKCTPVKVLEMVIKVEVFSFPLGLQLEEDEPGTVNLVGAILLNSTETK